MGVKLPVYGPDTFAITEVIEIAKNHAEGVICANALVNEDSAPANELRNMLTKSFGKAPTSIFYPA